MVCTLNLYHVVSVYSYFYHVVSVYSLTNLKVHFQVSAIARNGRSTIIKAVSLTVQCISRSSLIHCVVQA